MAGDTKRLLITVTPEMERNIDELKQKKFYNKSYSEMYRCILNAGMEAVKLENSTNINIERG